MQKMKRFLAWVALVAVMLTSFAFAEDIELVETSAPAPVEQTVEPAAEPVATQEPVEEPTEEPAEPTEAPAEEAPVEEAPVEETPVEEAPAEEASANEAAEPVLLSEEEHEHYMVCTKPGECYECGAELNSEDYNGGHNFWIVAEERDNWVDLGNGNHAVQCLNCGECFEVSEHWADCQKPGKCGECGMDIDPEVYGYSHSNYNEELEDWIYRDLGNGKHVEICQKCGEEFNEGGHWVSCLNPGKCGECGAELDPEEYGDGHWMKCTEPGVCQDCGMELDSEEYNYGHDGWDEAYGYWRGYDQGDGTHVYKCQNCGEYFGKDEHWADCRKGGKCGDCEAELDSEEYGDGHDGYDEAYGDWRGYDQGDGTHVYKCQNCGEYFGKDEHWADCRKGGKCGNCEAELDPEEYGYGHWTDCTKDGKCGNCGIELDPEEYGDGHWMICTEPGVCQNCGAELDPADYYYGHNGYDEAYGDWRGYDQGDGTHVYKCRNCGEYFGKDEHIFENGECYACGAKNGRLEALTVASKLTLGVGQVSAVEYEVTGGAKSITFKSSKTSVVTVDADGIMTAKKVGTAKISVTAVGFEGEKITKTVNVTVKKAPTKVTLSASSVALAQGETYTLKGKLSPTGAFSEAFWETDDASIVTVDASGVITAVAPGEAAVTVSTYNGKSATCVVTVLAAPTGIELDKAEITLNPKGTYTVIGELVNSEGLPCGGAISFKSADTSVATVTAGGKVTAKKVGETTITVETYNGCTAELLVHVMAVPKKVSVTPAKATMNKGDVLSLTASVNEGAYTTYKWSSSSKKIATVDANGFVTALKEGSVTVTVKTANGKTAKAKITVVDPYKPSKVELSHSGTVTIEVGEMLALDATLYPETAQSALKWSTSSKKVATVDANGVVTGVKAGTVTITVTTENGKKDTVKVKVVKNKTFESYKGSWKVSAVTFDGETFSAKEMGINGKISISVSDSSATLKVDGVSGKVSWSLADECLILDDTALCYIVDDGVMGVVFNIEDMDDMVFWFTK